VSAMMDSEQSNETRARKSKQKAGASFWEKLTDWPVIVVLVGWFFVVWLGLTYILLQEYSAPGNLSPSQAPVSLSFTYPKYIAVGEQGYIDVTVRNVATRTVSVSGTVVIDFRDDHIVRMSGSGTNTMEFKNLPPRGAQTSRIGFVLNQAQSFYRLGQAPPPVRFAVKAVDTEGNVVDAFSDQTIGIAPLPFLRTALVRITLVSGGVLGGALAVLRALAVDWLKQKFESSRSA
jgi:hypothetical protein